MLWAEFVVPVWGCCSDRTWRRARSTAAGRDFLFPSLVFCSKTSCTIVQMNFWHGECLEFWVLNTKLLGAKDEDHWGEQEACSSSIPMACSFVLCLSPTSLEPCEWKHMFPEAKREADKEERKEYFKYDPWVNEILRHNMIRSIEIGQSEHYGLGFVMAGSCSSSNFTYFNRSFHIGSKQVVLLANARPDRVHVDDLPCYILLKILYLSKFIVLFPFRDSLWLCNLPCGQIVCFTNAKRSSTTENSQSRKETQHFTDFESHHAVRQSKFFRWVGSWMKFYLEWWNCLQQFW